MINPGEVRVLIAEDEPDLRDLLAAKFRVFGFDVVTAENGTVAWDVLLKDSKVQIVITDIRMPNGTGYELLKKCKERDPVFPRVFLISAFSDFSQAHLFNMGSEGFISKPFDTKVLLSIVRKSLLSVSDRWRGQNVEIPEIKVEMNAPSFEESIQQNQFRLGRGGFCMKSDIKNLPEEGEGICYSVDTAPLSFHGTGVVRWKSSKQDPCIGIEIISLEGEHREDVVQWILENKPQAYVPCFDEI